MKLSSLRKIRVKAVALSKAPLPSAHRPQLPTPILALNVTSAFYQMDFGSFSDYLTLLDCRYLEHLISSSLDSETETGAIHLQTKATNKINNPHYSNTDIELGFNAIAVIQ